MAPKARPILDHSVRETVVERYLSATVPAFDQAMGIRLAKARQMMHITQRQLADLLGLNQTDVSRLEKGKKIAAVPNCERFRTVLGKHFEHVLVEDGYYREDEVTTGYNKQIRKYTLSKAR